MSIKLVNYKAGVTNIDRVNIAYELHELAKKSQYKTSRSYTSKLILIQEIKRVLGIEHAKDITDVIERLSALIDPRK